MRHPNDPTTVSYDPAFPSPHVGDPGLTKREYVAAMAMQGLLANLVELRKQGFKDEELAPFSLIQADALIIELNKDKDGK